jgi:sulfite reductase (NADPH) flavoprotein alpha-component
MSQASYIPESAPFNAEQRAWLNGFLAAWFIRQGLHASLPATPQTSALPPLLILYGSQSGNSEMLARRFGTAAGQHGFTARVLSMETFAVPDLAKETALLVVVSTWGDGDVPDSARGFWNQLQSPQAPRLERLGFTVLALGDTNYETTFCQAGKNFDRRLEELGGRRLAPRVDCSTDFESPANQWIESVWRSLHEPGAERHLLSPARSSAGSGGADAHRAGEEASAFTVPRHAQTPRQTLHEPGKPNGATRAAAAAVVAEPQLSEPGANGSNGFSRGRPFPARLLKQRCLTGPGSNKDTRHIELSLAGSGLVYEVGDSLGVFPTNHPALVDRILEKLGSSGDENVPTPEGAATSLRGALLHHYEINKISATAIRAASDRCPEAGLDRLLAADQTDALDQYLWGRDMLDLLCDFPGLRLTSAEFVGLLRRLAPRLYSISSSPKAHPEEVHLTVGPVRYESHGRARGGVCSTFLADRVEGATAPPVFVQRSAGFRLPVDPSAPVIMVGPGTGIAPFRAFLEERAAIGARGRNWLFFGEQQSATDFLYREEFETLRERKVLTRLDTAFSRDQADKIYVQHRLLENAWDVWRWLEDGAHIYVCGDAQRMAKDVDAALHEVVAKAGGRDREQASAYVQSLRREKRYQRDVY